MPNCQEAGEYPEEVSTFHAVDKLVRFGLEHLAECPEWFTPVKDVFFKPWNGDVTDKAGQKLHLKSAHVSITRHRTFWEIEMAKKYPVDFEAAARTPSSRASKRAPT